MSSVKVQIRPYVVAKRFTFRGLLFEPGTVFDPVTMQCDASKLKRLIDQRFLDVAADPAREQSEKLHKGRRTTAPPPAKEDQSQPEEVEEGPGEDAHEQEPDHEEEEPVATPTRRGSRRS